jgi:DNA polymerase-3 subunit gamma/tau
VYGLTLQPAFHILRLHNTGRKFMENKVHLALYRKWRPQTFDEVYGQEHITSVLKYEVGNGRLSHAYLFCGSRGTGKTSCAKILAKAVNCENPQGGNPCGLCAACRTIDSGSTTDVLEMDAASNNGVDDIRDIRDEVIYSPSSLKYRVYIIDEVHMLSQSAFNALLKTLEEPPAHVVFILATTELHKLPATIISRCQRFDFRRISTEVIKTHIIRIAAEEGIDIDSEAAHQIARLAQGGMRDAISLLELCAGGQRKITADTVADAVGSTGRSKVVETASAIARADYDSILRIVADVASSSKDIAVFWQELISLYRDMLVMKTTPDASRYLDLTDSETAQLKEITKLFRKETLLSHCRLLDDAYMNIQRSNAVRRTIAELTLIRMSDGRLDTSNEALLARIAKLEDAAACGGFQMQTNIANENGSASCVKSGSPHLEDGAQNTENSGAVRNPQDGSSKSEILNKPSGNLGLSAAEGDNAAKNNSARNNKEQNNPVQDKTVNNNSKIDKADLDSVKEKPKRVLKTLRCWAEAVERVSKVKQPLAAMLNGSKAYTDPEGRVLLRIRSNLFVSIIERDHDKDIIRAALSAELGRELKDNDIIIEDTSQDIAINAEDAIFDEIEQINKP